MTPTGAAGALELAERLFAAIEAGDIEAVRALYAPDAVVWHNYTGSPASSHALDGVEQTVEENLRTLTWVVRNLRGIRYEVRHRVATDDGFVQQHVLRAHGPGGEVRLPACLVVRLAGGRIARIDEYLDSAHLEALQPAPATPG